MTAWGDGAPGLLSFDDGSATGFLARRWPVVTSARNSTTAASTFSETPCAVYAVSSNGHDRRATPSAWAATCSYALSSDAPDATALRRACWRPCARLVVGVARASNASCADSARSSTNGSADSSRSLRGAPGLASATRGCESSRFRIWLHQVLLCSPASPRVRAWLRSSLTDASPPISSRSLIRTGTGDFANSSRRAEASRSERYRSESTDTTVMSEGTGNGIRVRRPSGHWTTALSSST